MSQATALLLCCLAVSALQIRAAPALGPNHNHDQAHYTRDVDFQWSSIQPSSSLQYTDCFDGFQCARLEVPMDWNSTELTDKFAVAIIRLPAKVEVSDPRYGGAILINPGGPGESGVVQALSTGVNLQTIFDAAYINGSDTYLVDVAEAKYFDIIGFDPRGANNTTPLLSCFATQGEAITWSLQNDMQLGTPEGPYDLIRQRDIAVNDNCFTGPGITPNGSRIADFVTTTSTARDMIEIAERHGEWREQQANDTSTQERLKWQKGEEPIQLYAVSYGSVLGTTLATMQPHRVSRFLLDGIVDANQYYAGNLTSSSIDVDALMERFFEYCAAAGPDVCPMSVSNSSDATKQLLQDIFTNLTDQGPISVAGGALTGPQVITLSDLKTILGSMIYVPLIGFPIFAEVVAPLCVRNGSALAEYFFAPLPAVPANDTIDPYEPTTGPSYFDPSADRTLYAVIGSDSTTHLNKTAFKTAWDSLRKVTYWNADRFATLSLPFTVWPSTPKWRLSDTHSIGSNATANPILFVSNLIDPAAPLNSAKNMHAAFARSALLLNDGEGHTTPASPSLCIVQAYRAYMQTGKTPQDLGPCLPYVRPFLGADGPRTAPFNTDGATKENLALYQASLGINTSED